MIFLWFFDIETISYRILSGGGEFRVSTDQKAVRLAFCDTKCISGETDGSESETVISWKKEICCRKKQR